MTETMKFVKAFVAAVVLTGLTVLGVGGVAVASAGGMNINATGGAGTVVDTDGTQGDLKPAVQGTPDDDNDQDAWLHGSQDFTPQYKAK